MNDRWEELTIFFFGIVIGFALLALIIAYEDVKSGQAWRWPEVAIMFAVATFVGVGVWGMVFGW